MPTPPDAEEPQRGPVLEPVRVLRPRRFDALAELMREIRQDAEGYEAVTPDPRTDRVEEETQELPTVRTPGARARTGIGLRRAAVVAVVGAAALVGFGGALLLPGRGDAAPSAGPSRSASGAPPAASASAADPDGPGTLREGDSGPEVLALQQRLLRIPDVYRDGPTDGRYDAVLTAAVARFQLWYGIRGDETGVYGDDTRRDLESRTNPGDG
ncbi:peptidoglycan-binding domain-containing protein [Streptomyces sp. NPDC001508]|uniref:peptidoglycan-binding domain-containing protein n=1 Tax=Streptomyces sp. NPDC001508 TaxID=3154656 RepID=UPI003323D990